MSKIFLTSIDLSQNEIQNVVVHKLAAHPENPVEGQIYFNTVDQITYQYKVIESVGSWQAIGSLASITSNHNALVVEDNGNGTLSLSMTEATATEAGLMSAADKSTLLGATSDATADTLVRRDADGSATFNNVFANEAHVSVVGDQPTSVVNRAYVDNLVSSGMSVRGVLDMTNGSVFYPTASAGDCFIANGSGTLFESESVEQGDMLVCIADYSGTPEDGKTASDYFIILQRNMEHADQIKAGTIRIATQVEVDEGTDAATAVTPATMATYIAAKLNEKTFGAYVGDGVALSNSIVHNLGTTDIVVQVKDVTTNQLVETDVVINDDASVSIGTSRAVAADQLRVVISS